MKSPWSTISHLLEGALATGVCTAAVGLVGLKGELLWEAAVGRLSSDPLSPPVTRETIFDLASLTKPLATALALMVLVTRGKLTLAVPLGEILPDDWLPPDKRPLTIRSLLAHHGGLPAWRPFYQEVLTALPAARATILESLAAATPLEYPPESATLYSDLGFMLLKAVVEQAAGEDLDRFCRREIYRPMGLAHLGFNPRRQPGGEHLPYVATEAGLIPDRNIWGEVHDENAWAAGGVAGHAGLFGTGREVFHLTGTLYGACQGDASGLFAPELVRLFLTPVAPGARPLGFDTPGPDPSRSAAGRYFSPRSVGHLGFTGVSFWLDLELGQTMVLLTNRVHLGRNNDKIRRFRPRFHEAASRALGLG